MEKQVRMEVRWVRAGELHMCMSAWWGHMQGCPQLPARGQRGAGWWACRSYGIEEEGGWR